MEGEAFLPNLINSTVSRRQRWLIRVDVHVETHSDSGPTSAQTHYNQRMRGPSPANPPEITLLDLFSGAGGLSQGFREASAETPGVSFKTLRAVEFDATAAATYEANHGEGIAYPGSIESWLESEETPRADVIIGGPPCQGFSGLGKREVRDSRNQLWIYYAKTIERSKPKYFVLENVPQFLQSPQFEDFKSACAKGGQLADYSFQAKILNSADYGAPQARKRVILIGHRRELPFPGFPPETHKKDASGDQAWRTLRLALAGIPHEVETRPLPDRSTLLSNRATPGPFRTSELHLGRKYESISLERFAAIGEGGNRFDLPENLKPACWRNHTTGSGDVMGRLRWDRPSVTIRTEFFKPEKGRYLHPSQPRALTHLEAARIQGFPDDYLWFGSKISIARQIGNAVPIPLGKAIAMQLTSALNYASDDVTRDQEIA